MSMSKMSSHARSGTSDRKRLALIVGQFLIKQGIRTGHGAPEIWCDSMLQKRCDLDTAAHGVLGDFADHPAAAGCAGHCRT